MVDDHIECAPGYIVNVNKRGTLHFPRLTAFLTDWRCSRRVGNHCRFTSAPIGQANEQAGMGPLLVSSCSMSIFRKINVACLCRFFPLYPLSILRNALVPRHYIFQANIVVTARISLSNLRSAHFALSILRV